MFPPDGPECRLSSRGKSFCLHFSKVEERQRGVWRVIGGVLWSTELPPTTGLFFFVYSLMLNQLSPIYKWTNLLLICMKEQFSSWNSGH